mmetsp:Transcript_53619/g.109747  ORF Transcript_53619/g.109747 Transcript_53619/m.109747 type:complete len:348 (-) Transcript_53619:239-1282(-)|eukprot:CAMPEP_0201197524 /NCGR_PEP_ID=MMETSP0851-20130426/154931_1 /ASSEMBLY_ACC=CAM_ASM_000631 /TAXON_ID=183588 /ORGANISM="Pseudo-nitzschia fraudulenta, Strain WWA7" /LENGTH=347 /DNA_ID=CAMNT_0047484625 /DNA_START=126 /DNA_END=1169 /DNA_ORIENTATION=-
MPRRPSKLSNCYVPLPLPEKGGGSEKSSSSGSGRKRSDDRLEGHELRQLCLETSVISRALGSSLVELGHTKVLAEAHIAPANLMGLNNKNNNSNNEATTDVGSLRCNVKYAPHIGIDQVSQQSRSVVPLDGNNNNNNNTGSSGDAVTSTHVSVGKLNQEVSVLESDLSRKMTAALLPVVVLERYPKCTVVVNLTVLQDDGSCLSAAITAASMALVDAQVELRDVVTSCTVAVVERASETNVGGCDDDSDDDDERWVYLADPTQQESTPSESFGNKDTALICLAMTPNHKEVTLWSQSGRLSSGMASDAMELCRDGCRTMHKLMRESWISSMEAQQLLPAVGIEMMTR